MKKRVNYTISEVTVRQIEELKVVTGCSASELIRKLVDKFWEERVGKK